MQFRWSEFSSTDKSRRIQKQVIRTRHCCSALSLSCVLPRSRFVRPREGRLSQTSGFAVRPSRCAPPRPCFVSPPRSHRARPRRRAPAHPDFEGHRLPRFCSSPPSRFFVSVLFDFFSFLLKTHHFLRMASEHRRRHLQVTHGARVCSGVLTKEPKRSPFGSLFLHCLKTIVPFRNRSRLRTETVASGSLWPQLLPGGGRPMCVCLVGVLQLLQWAGCLSACAAPLFLPTHVRPLVKLCCGHMSSSRLPGRWSRTAVATKPPPQAQDGWSTTSRRVVLLGTFAETDLSPAFTHFGSFFALPSNYLL